MLYTKVVLQCKFNSIHEQTSRKELTDDSMPHTAICIPLNPFCGHEKSHECSLKYLNSLKDTIVCANVFHSNQLCTVVKKITKLHLIVFGTSRQWDRLLRIRYSIRRHRPTACTVIRLCVWQFRTLKLSALRAGFHSPFNFQLGWSWLHLLSHPKITSSW